MASKEETKDLGAKKTDDSAEEIREELISSARQSPMPADAPKPANRDLTPPLPGADKGALDISRGKKTLGDLLQTRITLLPPNVGDMAIFCRQLSTLLDVGIPLLQSLKILAERTTHSKLRRVVAQVAGRVEEGNTLSSALREHPRIFSYLFVSVVEVGELGGILESSVQRLAEILESKMAIKKKVTSAMMYPITAVCVCVGVVFFIMYWAVPRFQGIYEGLGKAELADITQNLIAISDFIRDYPGIYVPLIVLMAAGLFIFSKTPSGQRSFDYLALKFYIVGRVNTKINVARFARSLGSLVAAGIPLLEALRVTAQTSENTLIARKLQQVHDSLEQGGRIEEPLREDSIVPPMVVDMMVIGYEAGAVEDMLLNIAKTYDTDVDETLKGLASIIEPALIVMLGLVVVFVALALLLPYFNLVHVV